jgi:hypothetical protein
VRDIAAVPRRRFVRIGSAILGIVEMESGTILDFRLIDGVYAYGFTYFLEKNANL